MKILVLDDDIIRLGAFRNLLAKHDLILVEDAPAAIEQIKNNLFDIIFLDHDLGGRQYVLSGPDTGYEVAEYLANTPVVQMIEPLTEMKIIIHSYNPIGAENMYKILSKNFFCIKAPIGGDHFNEIIKQINA